MSNVHSGLDDYERWKLRQITPSGKTEQHDALTYFANIIGYCHKIASAPETSIPDRLKAMEVGASAAFYQLQIQELERAHD